MRDVAAVCVFALGWLCAGVSAGLTPAEEAAGWRMLFDGESWEGWRSYGKDGPPSQGWEIEDGSLRVVSGGGGGDIVTEESFKDFELSLEFRVAPGANSGIIYRVSEDLDYPWQTGPEYQILDDAGSHEGVVDTHSVGTVYDLYPASEDRRTLPAGQWNTARIRIADGVVKHFLNGVKTVEYDMHSDEWKARIAESKFRGYEGFGVQREGRIALQDHGDDIWYRNIKIRELGEAADGARVLMDGESLEGWESFVPGGEEGETFRVEDGVLVCTGSPSGYLGTVDEFGDFVLRLRWRYLPGQPGNSGVLIRSVGENRVWPDSIEAQLQSGRAGDFVNLTGESMKMARADGRFGRRSHDAERPLGEWNEYEIIAEGGEVRLWVNGEAVNSAAGAPARSGRICLQSEGVEIHFDDITVAEIE